MKRYHRLFVVLGFPVFCLAILQLTVRTVNYFQIDQNALNTASRNVLERITELGVRAQDFDETVALCELGKNHHNGACFRFDENLDKARFFASAEITRDSPPFDRRVCFEFAGRDDLQIRPHSGEYSVEDGILKYVHDDSNFLESRDDISIDTDSIGEIEARLKVTAAKKIILAWSQHPDAERFSRFKTNVLTIWSIPDGRFHVYRVDAAPILKGLMDTGDRIRKLFLFPFQVPYDEVEIDYLRFIPKAEKYLKNGYGIAYETKGVEMRSTLYMRSNAVLEYEVEIPAGESFLDVGLGCFQPDDTLTCRITIRTPDFSDVLVTQKMCDNHKWHDVSVSLSKYSGRRATISMATRGSPNNVVFLSSPVLYAEPRHHLNIVIVVEDALRADHLSSYGYNSRTTPVKDALAARGVLFKNAYSQSTETWSSCASFMTSLYPSATGVWDGSDVLDGGYLTLAEVMRSQGFATASFLQNVLAGPATGLHQGFDTIFDHETITTSADSAYGSRALREWLRSNARRNVFLYLHVLDPHGPYGPQNPPAEFISLVETHFSEGVQSVEKDDQYEPEWLAMPSVESRNYLYTEEVRFNDSQLPLLLSMLEAAGIDKSTLIIFIADHGEHLGEHDVWGHQPPGYRQVIHVPFIAAYPEGFPGGKEIAQPVQLLDLMPTILDVAGIERGGLLLAGESLLPLILGKDSTTGIDRIALSEEVRFMKRDDNRGYGSILWRDSHMLSSQFINDAFARYVRKSGRTSTLGLLSTRVFDLLHDDNEQRLSGSIAMDLWFQHWIARFFENFKKRNLSIGDALTRHSERIVERDQKAVDQLRVLGYVE